MKREQMAERFLEYPFIYFVVRSWLLSWRARIAMLLGAMMFFGFALGLPKIWKVTPKDFNPVVRISLLDEIKARALEHNAKKYLRQDRVDYGIMAYSSSIAHNLGNLDRIRTFLRLSTHRQLERGSVELDTITIYGLRYANWLRKISTDQGDLQLVAEFLDAMEFDDDLLGVLAPERSHLSDQLRRIYIKGLLRQGYIEQFEALWRVWNPREEWEKDLEMKLYRAAATAAYSRDGRFPEARGFLEAHLTEGEMKVVANRLYEIFCFEQRDPNGYLQALKRLEDWRKDKLTDHSRAWRLLAAKGRKEEALKMADQFNRAPRTAVETSLLAAAYTELGMKADAQKLLDQFIARFGFYERLWVQQGTLLASSKEWTALRNLIAKMRLEPSVAHRMEGFSYYLEGVSELGEGRKAAAYELFQRIPNYRIPNLDVAFAVIDQMRALGHLDIAARMVAQAEDEAKDSPRYWMFVAQLGSELKDEELLLKATEQYLRLQPADVTAKSNFAAALLAARQRPSEAVKVTFELMSLASTVAPFQINHAAALALNSRYSDAEKLLDEVNLGRLGDLERTMFYFVATESLVGQEKFVRARATASKVQERFLYPKQVAAFNDWKVKIEDALKPKAEAASK